MMGSSFDGWSGSQIQKAQVNAYDICIAAGSAGGFFHGGDACNRFRLPAARNSGSYVSCTGCSLYAHRRELANSAAIFRRIENEDSNGHMTIIRKKGTKCVNADTMQSVDAFLAGIDQRN